MNLTPVFSERHCPNCRQLKPLEDFASHRYCRACKSEQDASRNGLKRSGAFTPTVVTDRAPPRPRLIPAPAEPRERAVHPVGGDAALALAMEVFLLNFGFSALRVTITRLEGELSKKHREALARQGWIA